MAVENLQNKAKGKNFSTNPYSHVLNLRTCVLSMSMY